MTTGSATGGPAVVHAAAQSTVRARAERVAGPLAAAWAALQVELALLQSRWPNESGAVRARRARLLAVHARDSMDVLDASLDGSVQAAVDGTYDAATDVAAAAVPAGQQPVGRPSSSGLVDALTADLRAALSFVAVTARTLAADLARLAGGELPAAEARAAVERLVRDRGVAAVVYRDGSRYGLDTYAEMASRTKLAETWQVASFRLFAAAGVGWVEITDGAGCFAGDTRMLAYDGLVQVIRTAYKGPAYRIRTGACPEGVTVGANHPVLTRRGLVPAHLLREDDEVVHDTRLRNPAGGPEPDFEDVPAVADLFESLRERLGSTRRPATNGDDLHSDASFGDGEIEVVRSAWPLLLEADTAPGQKRGELCFVLPDAALRLVAGDREPLAHLPRVLHAAGGVVRGRDLACSLILSELAPLKVGAALGRTELVDALGASPARDGLSTVQTREDVQHFVATPLLGIEEIDFDGYMYDATSVAGLLTLDSLVASNCGWVSHDDPDKANGKIVTLDEALANPIAHPNCSRSSYPRLDVTSLEDAAGADPLGGGTLLDDGGPDVPSERGPGGLLSFRPPHMLAPAAARHAMVLARARARVSVGAGIAVGSQRLGSRPRRGPGSG